MVSIIELIGLNHSNPELLNLRILQPYFVKFLPAEVLTSILLSTISYFFSLIAYYVCQTGGKMTFEGIAT